MLTFPEDENTEQEPPETPAPLFAARALKSALFGTPGFVDDTMHDGGTDTEKAGSTDTRQLLSRSVSPTKPQGILLTPGTATSRRKTVSFGNEVLDNAIKLSSNVENGGIGQDSKLEPSSRTSRKTSLTKTLENAREIKSGTSELEKPKRLSETQPLLDLGSRPGDGGKSISSGKASNSGNNNQEIVKEFHADDDGDMTVDLNHPHSQSGKHWKTKHEQYQEDARTEMAKLVKYKHLAKTYAKKKDAEAMELAAQLKVEQRRVQTMEEQISRLSSQITSTCLDGMRDDSPELIRELARQTALAVQYRAQVEEFRAAVEGNEELANGSSGKRLASPRTAQTLLDTHCELKKAREQLIEINALRDEMDHMRQTLSTAEKNNLKLREENTKLAQDLLHADYRLEKQNEKAEKRRTCFEEQSRRKDEAYQSLQKDYDHLKEQAKVQRREAERLLKKRHDQLVALRKELASMKGVGAAVKDLEITIGRQAAEHDRLVSGHLEEIERLKGLATQHERVRSNQEAHSVAGEEDTSKVQQHRRPKTVDDTVKARESVLSIANPSISRPSKSRAPPQNSRNTPSGSPVTKRRPSQPALAVINNNASSERLAFKKSDLVQSTPHAEKYSNVLLEELELNLPSPEPSLPSISTRALHERSRPISPRPSMFNIDSSPPKAAMIRPRDEHHSSQRSNGELADRRHNSRQVSLESSRIRDALPPARAAAAKARLEQRNADKKRVQALGIDKENVGE